jgi:hypothetical protein
MPRKNSFEDQMENALEHAIAKAMGKKPKRPLIVDGPIRPRCMMTEEIKHLPNFESIGRYVLSNGTWFEDRARVRDYAIAVDWEKEQRPKGGQCFANAREFCLAIPKVRYFEGFYLIFENPQDHAWIVMEDGQVLDFTLEVVIRNLKTEKDQVHVRPPLYLGVEVPRDQLYALHESVESNEPILELYKNLSRKRSD